MRKLWSWLCVYKPRTPFIASYWTLALMLAIPVGSLVTRHPVPSIVVVLAITAFTTGYKSLKDNTSPGSKNA